MDFNSASPASIIATAEHFTFIPTEIPSFSLESTSNNGISFSLHRIGKCCVSSFGSTSAAIATSFATPRSTALVTSLMPLSIFPVLLAFSTTSYTDAI